MIDRQSEAIAVRRRTPAERLARLPRYWLALVSCLRPGFVRFARLWLATSPTLRGWLRAPDAFLLYELARSGPGEGQIVEIGSAWGRSTVALAAGTRAARREHVIAIDPHGGDDWYLAEYDLPHDNSLAEFRANLKTHSVDGWVDEAVMTSEAAAKVVPNDPIRLLFIDGLHTYAGVRSDIDIWVRRVAHGGVIVFDDYDNRDPGMGVRRAVDELLASKLVDARLQQRFNLVWTYRRGESTD